MKKNNATGIREFPLDYSEDKKTFDFYVPKVKEMAANVLGIYRKGEDLQKAFETLKQLSKKNDLKNDTNAYQIVISIMLMMQAALLRKESRGTHIRIDYPDSRDVLLKEIIL